MLRIPLIAIAIAALTTTPLAAESFTVKLGAISLGEMHYTAKGRGADLRSKLANTPLGVFNGIFRGTTRAENGTQHFTGISKSSRKSREVRVGIKAGRAVSTVVLPPSEETALSNPAKAPNNVIDPVAAIGKLISSKGCPKRINIYDGRRAIALIPTGSEQRDASLICTINYKVTHGPGHLSPLKISKASMQVTYDMDAASQNIRQIRLGSGVFKLVLDRMR